MAGNLKSSTRLVHERFQKLIQANPGIHIRQLSLLTGLSWNTVQHHLRTMQRLQKVTPRKIEGKVCWYDCSQGAVKGKAAAFLLRDPENLRIAQTIMADPGNNQRYFAAKTGLAPSIIHRRVTKMEEAGLVERIPGGRSVSVFPSERLQDLSAEFEAPAAQPYAISVF